MSQSSVKNQKLALQRKQFHFDYRYSANRFLKKAKVEKIKLFSVFQMQNLRSLCELLKYQK